MTRFMIDAVHSKWGRVQLEVIRETEDQLRFNYPSGALMGGWDREMGGGLGHPSEEVERFVLSLPDRKLGLLDLDEPAYCDLECLIEDEVRKHLPDFLTVPTREELRRERDIAAAERARQLSTLSGLKLHMLSLSPRDLIVADLDSFSAYAYVELPAYMQAAYDKLSDEDKENFSSFEQEYQERMESEGYDCLEEMRREVLDGTA